MNRFKGTTEKWKRVLREKTAAYPRTNEIQFGNDGECVAEFILNDYDAQLISKCPEMLEMLIDILDTQANGDVFHSYKIEQLIKEATEI